MARFGVIHGDPHLGNYSVWRENGEPAGINLLDYGCIRIFPPRFAAGVVELYRGFLANDEARIVHAYELWGFKDLSRDLIDHAQHLGALYLLSAAGGPGPHHRRRRRAGPVRAARGVPAASGAQGAGAGGGAA